MVWDNAAKRISKDSTADTVATIRQLRPGRYPATWFILGGGQ